MKNNENATKQNEITKIYLVKNCYDDPNKVYIGKTKNTRYYHHKKTYGNNIEYTIIDEINSLKRKDWGFLEDYWLEQFRQWGFEVVNINKKGGSGPEFLSEKSRTKIRLKKKGIIFSTEWKNKISIAKKGISKPKEFGNKVRNNRDHKKLGKLIQKPINQYDLKGKFIKEWPSNKSISKYFKISPSCITDTCNGKQKSSCGFIWKFKEKTNEKKSLVCT